MVDNLRDALAYILANPDRFTPALLRHLQLSFAALAIGAAICLPLGIAIARQGRFAQATINAVGALRLVPSLAILFLAQPLLGIGFVPSLLALTILAMPPILINTYAGVRGVAAEVVEAATGIGMGSGQRLWQIELPLALPALITGIRTAAVEVISSATLAAFIGGGGLGIFITRGFATNQPALMLVGALPVALLALGAELILLLIQRRVSVAA